METKKIYSRLKYRYVELEIVPGQLVYTIELEFAVPYLLVGVFTPEVSQDVETYINRVNLLPYELSVQKFANSDILYDYSSVNNPGKRVLEGFKTVVDNTNNTNGMVPVIISYLEFPKN